MHYTIQASSNGETSADEDKKLESIMWALLHSGADTEIHGRDGIGPLHCAARSNGKATGILLQAGASVDIQENSRKTPLHWAAYTGCVDAIDLFLQKGAYGGARDDYGRTPLHLAAIAGWDKAVEKLMVDERVERNSIDRDGRTPLHLAAIKGTEKVVELLLRGIEDRGEDRNGYNAVANTADNNQFTPLYLAAMFGHENAAGQLLKMYNEENGRQKLISFGIAILFGRKGVVTLLAVINKKYIESALKFAQGL